MFIIVQGDNDIDYVSAYGPYSTEADADAALNQVEVAHPGSLDEAERSGQNMPRIVKLNSTADLIASYA